MSTLVVFSGLLLAYAALSRRLEQLWITAAMAFVFAGAVLALSGKTGAATAFSPEAIKLLAEAALAITLFSDAARVDLKALRSGLALPARLLSVGLLLTILAGALVAIPLFPSLTIAEILLVAVILAPTDAALGQRVVLDTSVPLPIRQGLNVESGLNDGIAVPIYLVALDLAKSAEASSGGHGLLQTAAQQIGIGILAGIAAGVVAGWILHRFGSEDWIESAWRQVVMVAGAGLAYALATALGGSGFIAAFVGGIGFGYVAKDRGPGTAYLSEEISALLSAAVFLIAGVIAVVVLKDATWQVLVYAVLSLTVVRMVPVAIACVGTSLKPQSVAFIGWFGPRGLASIVFGLGILEASLPGESVIIQAIMATVVMSVIAHGVSATPLAAAYGRWSARTVTASHAEATKTHEQRARLRI